MSTKKNNKSVVTNIRDLGKAVAETKPAKSFVKQYIMAEFQEEVDTMHKVSDLWKNLRSLQAEYDSIAPKVTEMNVAKRRIDKAVFEATREANEVIDGDEELQALRKSLSSNNRINDWLNVRRQAIEAYVSDFVGQDALEELHHINSEGAILARHGLNLKEQIDILKKEIDLLECRKLPQGA